MQPTHPGRAFLHNIIPLAYPSVVREDGSLLQKRGAKLVSNVAVELALLVGAIKNIPFTEAGKKFGHLAQNPKLENVAHAVDTTYAGMRIEGREHFPVGKPTIVIPVHPTGLADGILSVGLTKQLAGEVPVKTFARAELRGLDRIEAVHTEGPSGSRVNKDEVLGRVEEILRANGVIVVFPSGSIGTLDAQGNVVESRWSRNAFKVANHFADLDVHIQPIHISANLPTQGYEDIAHSRKQKNTVSKMTTRTRGLLTLALSVNAENTAIELRKPLDSERIRTLCAAVQHDVDWGIVTEAIKQYTLTGNDPESYLHTLAVHEQRHRDAIKDDIHYLVEVSRKTVAEVQEMYALVEHIDDKANAVAHHEEITRLETLLDETSKSQIIVGDTERARKKMSDELLAAWL